MYARVSSRPRVGAAGAGRLAITESASITEIALAASRCARWMVMVLVSTSRWTMYLTLRPLPLPQHELHFAKRLEVVHRLEKQAISLRPAPSARSELSLLRILRVAKGLRVCAHHHAAQLEAPVDQS
jgi:hypothetical protein